MCVREESSTRKYYRNNINSGAVFISVGRAPAPCVEAIVLTAGGPDSKHASSGPILRFTPPPPISCHSLSTVLSIKGIKAQKKYLKKDKNNNNDIN